MAGQFKVTDKDRGWQKLLVTAKAIGERGSYAKAGVIGERAGEQHEGEKGPMTNATLAVIHEFGALAAGIPERPFIRSAFDKGRGKYQDQVRKLVGLIYDLKMPAQRALGILGLQMSSDQKAGIREGSGIPPPLAPATIRRKRAKGKWNKGGATSGASPRPLVDTGQLVRSLTHEVVVAGGPVAQASSGVVEGSE